jgi:hypothetical protein
MLHLLVETVHLGSYRQHSVTEILFILWRLLAVITDRSILKLTRFGACNMYMESREFFAWHVAIYLCTVSWICSISVLKLSLRTSNCVCIRT